MSENTYNPLIGLHPEIIGSGTVLNNGVTPNTIHFGITNNNLFGASNPNHVDIPITTNTKIFIWFIVDDKQASSHNPDREWALTSYAAFHNNQVKVNIILPDGADDTHNWIISRNKPSALKRVSPTLTSSLDGWELIRKSETKIKPGGTLKIQISGLVVFPQDGPTVGYFRWLTPTGGTMLTFGPIQKTPHVLRGNKVGVDTNAPAVSLDVRGGIRAKGGAPGAGGANNTGYFFNPPGDNDSGMTSSGDGQVEFYVNSREAMRIKDNNGTKVGIATTQPDAQLHVSSDGLTEDQVALRVGDKGKIAIDSDGTIGGRVTVLQNGNVGIGKNPPQLKLDIGGAGNSNIEFAVNGRLKSGGNAGGLWVDDKSQRFVGAVDNDQIGLFNYGWRLNVDSAGKVNIPGDLIVGGNVDSIFKAVAIQEFIGGPDSNSGKEKWEITVPYGVTFKETPVAFAVFGGFSSYKVNYYPGYLPFQLNQHQTEGGGAEIGRAFVRVWSTYKDKAVVRGFVDEDSHYSDNCIFFTLIAMGRV